jgi:hypothetical protein
MITPHTVREAIVPLFFVFSPQSALFFRFFPSFFSFFFTLHAFVVAPDLAWRLQRLRELLRHCLLCALSWACLIAWCVIVMSLHDVISTNHRAHDPTGLSLCPFSVSRRASYNAQIARSTVRVQALSDLITITALHNHQLHARSSSARPERLPKSNLALLGQHAQPHAELERWIRSGEHPLRARTQRQCTRQAEGSARPKRAKSDRVKNEASRLIQPKMPRTHPKTKNNQPRHHHKNTKKKPRRAATGKKPRQVIPRQRHRLTEAVTGGTLNAYLRLLSDPWYASPVRLGWGTFIPTSVRQGWLRNLVTPNATSTCFCVVSTPAIASSATLPCFSNYYDAALGTTAVSSSVSQLAFPATNATTLAVTADSARAIAGALRLTVRYPATSIRGSLYGLFVPDDTRATFLTGTYNYFINLFATRTAQSVAGGEISCEVQYRPADVSSFQFGSGMVSNPAAGSASVGVPQLIIIGVGWPAAGFSVSWDVIWHYETLGGFDSAGEDVNDGGTLAANGVTMEAAGAASANSGPAVITDAALLGKIDSETSHLGRLNAIAARGQRLGQQNASAVLDSGVSAAAALGVYAAGGGHRSLAADGHGPLPEPGAAYSLISPGELGAVPTAGLVNPPPNLAQPSGPLASLPPPLAVNGPHWDYVSVSVPAAAKPGRA